MGTDSSGLPTASATLNEINLVDASAGLTGMDGGVQFAPGESAEIIVRESDSNPAEDEADARTENISLSIPKEQLIFLDFDGAMTAYHGELLTIEDVAVSDFGLAPEKIAAVTAALNARFAGQNVRFTSNPADIAARADYSTIYIGRTSAFEPYGAFSGLAETIDSGNRIANDNAFVMLDSSGDPEQIAQTIAHETAHLLGTLDHGGDGLSRYASDDSAPSGGYIYFYYSNNHILTGTLSHYYNALSHYTSSTTLFFSDMTQAWTVIFPAVSALVVTVQIMLP